MTGRPTNGNTLTDSTVGMEDLFALVQDFRRHIGQLEPVMRGPASEFVARPDVQQLLAEKRLHDPGKAVDLIHEVVRFCVIGRLQPLLSAYELPTPTYNYFEDYAENAVKPWAPPAEQSEWRSPDTWRVLGFQVRFPIGVPASVLTANSTWVDFYLRQGFNIVTYKTVRSARFDAHPAPNWVFLPELTQPLDGADSQRAVLGDITSWPSTPTALSMANSFGVPSADPEEWQEDIRTACRSLMTGQLLIVSVMGTHEIHEGSDLLDDFARVAHMAEDAGARVIELNLSCPNTIDQTKGQVKNEFLCESPPATTAVVEAVRGKLRADTRLVLKLASMRRETLEEVVAPLATRNLIDGISGINTIQMRVHDKSGQPVFPPRDGASRELAGVSGIAIRNLGMRFVRDLASIRRENRLAFDIIAMGGAMDPVDVARYLRAGAQAVQAATAAFFNPQLPRQVKEFFAGPPMTETGLAARAKLLEVLERGPTTLDHLASELNESVLRASDALRDRTRGILESLESEGLVEPRHEGGRLTFAVTEPARAQA